MIRHHRFRRYHPMSDDDVRRAVYSAGSNSITDNTIKSPYYSGQVAERSIAADCKSAGATLRRFKSFPSQFILWALSSFG